MIKSMGVINLTPNSFSDANKNFNTTHLKETLILYLQTPSLIFDFGFESTAPMNAAISENEERERFDLFFKNIKEFNLDFRGRFISFDTYRPRSFCYFQKKWKELYPDCTFIFNDVSGILDEELASVLLELNCYYIYCFSHIPSRSQVLKHREFCRTSENIIERSKEQFQKCFGFFENLNRTQYLILDPGFGFSKTYEENWTLLEGLPKLILELKEKRGDIPWLVGLSKKSFMQKKISGDCESSEILHKERIKILLKENLGTLIFRAHDPHLVTLAYDELFSL